MSRILVARNSALLLTAQLVARASGLVVFGFVARFLSTDQVGVFGYAMTMVGFLTIAVEFGFDLVVVREASQGDGLRSAGLALRLKTLQFIALYPALVAVAAWQAGSGAALAAVAVLGAAVWPDSVSRTVAAYYLARGRAQYGLASEAIASLLRLLLVPAILLAGAHLLGLSAGYWAASALTAAALAAWAWRQGFRPTFRSPRGEARRVYVEAAAFAVYSLLASLCFRLDIVLLKGLRPDDEVGRYVAAFRVIEAMLVLPAVLTGALYPVLAKLDGQGDRAAFGRACAEATRWLGVAGLGAALVIGGAAPLVIRLIAGPGYDGAVVYLRWLLPSFALVCVQCIALIAMNAAGRQRSNIAVMLVGAGVKVAFNLALIPAYGAIAACLGSVLTSAVITVHVAVIARDLFRPREWLRAWAGSGVALAAALAVLALGRTAPGAGLVGASLVVFVAFACATRALRRSDVVTVRDLLRSGAAGVTGAHR
jgi:O-antigen/teichoic acid export membrane protein